MVPQNSRLQYTAKKYKFAKQALEHNKLTPAEIKKLQRVIGAFLWYGRITDSTMLHTLNTLASAQTKGNEETMHAMNHFLDYCATHPNATICFHASDMILKIHSDASYLSETEARSRVGGYFFLGNKDDTLNRNGAIHIIAKIIKNVVSSAAEAEIAGIYTCAKEAVPVRLNLDEMGHVQPPTEIITDNLTACGILNKTCKQTRSKAIDMNYYWVRDRISQKQFNLIWKRGSENLADYFTKHHPPAHHKRMRPIYLHCIEEKLANMAKSEDLRGCVDQANGAKKVSIKSSLRITKSGAKRLSREVMVKGIYGAKKASLAASTSEIRDKSSSVRTKTGISKSIKTASWNGLSKIKS